MFLFREQYYQPKSYSIWPFCIFKIRWFVSKKMYLPNKLNLPVRESWGPPRGPFCFSLPTYGFATKSVRSPFLSRNFTRILWTFAYKSKIGTIRVGMAWFGLICEVESSPESNNALLSNLDVEEAISLFLPTTFFFGSVCYDNWEST